MQPSRGALGSKPKNMLIGILGAGEVALAFSRYALRAGHQVRLSNSRGPESLKDVVKELGTGASAGTIREAAQAPIVLIAIPWPKVDEVLKSLPDKWENRILIDAADATARRSAGRTRLGPDR